MKFTVHRTAFIQYLNDVQRAISSKAALERSEEHTSELQSQR